MENKNAPAYPTRYYDEGLGISKLTTGLTKHEAFAMAAMQGLMPILIPTTDNQLCPNDEGVELVVNLSVKAADLLIEQLKK